jgi:ssDNA-binding Zn-finger/Zn-ribbon topoisomerase 1
MKDDIKERDVKKYHRSTYGFRTLVSGTEIIQEIVSLQDNYKFDKPVKFLGGRWSPKAWNLYNFTLDDEDKKRADIAIEHLYSDKRNPMTGEVYKIIDTDCPKCGLKMMEKDGKYGLFYSCTQFPSCWGTLPHPDNPDPKFPPKKKAEPELRFDMKVRSYISYSLKRNGKPVKSGTPTSHSISFDNDVRYYVINTRGSRQHLYKGDTCNFKCKKNWEGNWVIHKATLKAFNKKGQPIEDKYRNR